MCSAEDHIYKMYISSDTKQALEFVALFREREGDRSDLQLRVGILLYCYMAVKPVQ